MCTKFQVTVYASKFSLASEVFFLSLSVRFFFLLYFTMLIRNCLLVVYTLALLPCARVSVSLQVCATAVVVFVSATVLVGAVAGWKIIKANKCTTPICCTFLSSAAAQL